MPENETHGTQATASERGGVALSVCRPLPERQPVDRWSFLGDGLSQNILLQPLVVKLRALGGKARVCLRF